MSLTEILLTGRLIAVAWVGCFAVGVPLVVLGASFLRTTADVRDVWFYSSLVGAAAIILICQNLLYLDVTLSRSAVLVWLLAGAGWAAVLSSASKRAMLLPLPWPALVLGAAVYLIHGTGLIELGASHYYGYGWYDMFNYVSLAQFFSDLPFHSISNDHGYLVAAQQFKSDRIGQSVLHAFFLVSSGSDAQQSFGTTILLSPFLLFFAFLTIARRLTSTSIVAHLAALAGALSPTVATVHLESFFSQAMCLPFLVLWPAAVGRLIETPGWRTALTAGLLLAAICSVYTETVPIALAISVVCCFAKDAAGLKPLQTIFSGRLYQPRSSRYYCEITLVWLPIAVAFAIIANLGFLSSAIGIFSRTTTGDVLVGIYPWAFKIAGLARLWLGNQVNLEPEWITWAAAAATAAVVAVNLISMTAYAKRSFSFFFLALVMLMLVPLGPLIAGKGSLYGYQFYKLLLMTSPLHAFWFVIGCNLLLRQPFAAKSYAPAFGALFVAVNSFLLIGITHASAKVSTIANSHRGGAHLLIGADFRQLRDFLAVTRNRNVLTLWFDNELGAGSYRTAWIDYFARNNRVFSINSIAGGGSVADSIIEKLFPDKETSSQGLPLVVAWKAVEGLKHRLVFSNSRIFVYDAETAASVRQLIDESRVTSSRNLKLDAVHPFDAENWFPIWIAGDANSVSLLTMKFGEFNQFRYDQWGYPAAHFQPGGDCRGKVMALTVQFLQLEKRLRLTCNGVVAEADIPLAFTALDDRSPARFGWSAGIKSLEGKYRLAEEFPGPIVELSANAR
jgi:hypothetical protein